MPKIVILGAGSAFFGLYTLGSLLRSPKLQGSEIVLVDRLSTYLDRMVRLAERVNCASTQASSVTDSLLCKACYSTLSSLTWIWPVKSWMII